MATTGLNDDEKSRLKVRKKLAIRLGKRIRKARESKGITQENLAFEAGLHRTYVGLVENGDRLPTLTILSELAKAMKVDMADLVRGL